MFTYIVIELRFYCFLCILMFSCCLFYRSVFLYVFIVYLYSYFCAASYGVIKNNSNYSSLNSTTPVGSVLCNCLSFIFDLLCDMGLFA